MTIRDLLNDNPDFMDYTICLSQFFTVPDANGEELEIATDFPVLGIGSNDDEKELRFIIEAKDLAIIKNAKTRVIHIVDQALAAKRDQEDGR